MVGWLLRLLLLLSLVVDGLHPAALSPTDSNGNRVKATFGSTTTVYVGNTYERDNGSTVRKYYYAGGARMAMRSGGQTYYLLGDHLGGTNVTANGIDGGFLGRVLYKPWGETRFTTGTTPTTWRFTGQREDATIGLYYYGARFYDPYLNRWIQPDTIVPNPGDPQSLNRYSYVLNNPIKYTDPTGHAMALDEWGGTPSPVVIFGQAYDWTREVIFHWLDKNPQYNPTSDPILAGETFAGALEPGVAAAIVSLEYGLWQLDRGVPSGADVAGTGFLGLAILAGSDGKATPKDLYAFGNRAGPRPPRAGIDVSPNADGMLSPQAPPFPEGASAFANPDNAPLTGHYHRLPAGTELPQGLDVVADGLDVNVASYQPVTHHTIFNTVEMAFDRFVDLFSSLPWQYGGRK